MFRDRLQRIAVGLPTRVLAAGFLVLASFPVPAVLRAEGVIMPRRDVPAVDPLPLRPLFSESPTTAEIRAARVFGEPVVAVGAGPGVAENRDLAEALLAFLDRSSEGDESAIDGFLEEHPTSPYRPSLLLNLGLARERRGAVGSAISALQDAWDAAKTDTSPLGTEVANRAVAEWAELARKLGDAALLEQILTEVGDRSVAGSAGQKLGYAQLGYADLTRKTEAVAPAAAVALKSLLEASGKGDPETEARLANLRATGPIPTLGAIRDQSGALGVPLQLVERTAGEIPTPSLAHLRVGHLTPVLRRDGRRYLVDDDLLGGRRWLPEETLVGEGDGLFLIPAGSIPSGYTAAGAASENLEVPLGDPSIPDENGPEPNDPEAGGGSCSGMPRWGLYKLHASLHLSDVPVGYTPPIGPSVQFQLDYNERDVQQPAIFSFSNVGPLWTHRWLTYLEDDPLDDSAPVRIYQPGGGIEEGAGYDPATGSYQRDFETRAQIFRTSSDPIVYERRLPDGTVETYAASDGSQTSPRRVFRTQVMDPQGRSQTFTYDFNSGVRLLAITDALGQVTTLSYDLPSDPLKITQVTDPFGRSATLDYDSSGRLASITDVIGMTSQIGYLPQGVVGTLTTPYGRTTFSTNTWSLPLNDSYWLYAEAVDPLGGKERVEYQAIADDASLPDVDPIEPVGFHTRNSDLRRRVSFYWDKRAMALYPGDETKAEITHWLLVPGSTFTPVSTPHSIKKPLENRVWYTYPDQGANIRRIGSQGSPSKVARVLDDGQTQFFSYSYNEQGQRTTMSDPLGRTTVYSYAANGVDLLEVRQAVLSGGLDLLQSFTYNANHQPLTKTDAAGQTTTYTYNPDGTLASVETPPRAGISENRTTTYTYDPNGFGYLMSVTGPDGVVSESYTYDSVGRRATVTDTNGYTLTFGYDALDRVTTVTFPDSTYDQTIYDRLDAVGHRDRMGRWTHTAYDALRRVVSVTDAMGRTVTSNEWLSCSSSCNGEKLSRVVDGNGNATTWEYDLEGRVTKEIRADGTSYQYILRGRDEPAEVDPRPESECQDVQLQPRRHGGGDFVRSKARALPTRPMSLSPTIRPTIAWLRWWTEPGRRPTRTMP